MSATARDCAREILEVTPVIIQAIRFEMRSLRLSDLSVPHFRTLAYIRRNPGASLSAAAEFIGLTLSSMSILINGLVDAGLVLRTTGTTDRRRIHLTLTAEGEALFVNVLGGTEERLADLLAGLNAEERQTIVRALELLLPVFQPRALAPARDEVGAAPHAAPTIAAPPKAEPQTKSPRRSGASKPTSARPAAPAPNEKAGAAKPTP